MPKEGILAEADAYNPPQARAIPLVAPKVPYAAALYDNIHRLNLDVRTIVPFHGMRTVDLSEVARQSHRLAATQQQFSLDSVRDLEGGYTLPFEIAAFVQVAASLMVIAR